MPEDDSQTAPPPPRHIAVIMDGNGRWALERGLSRSQGHKAGSETAKDIVAACRELGVEHLTLYTFSRENWKRPADEVKALFQLLIDFLTRELPSLVKQDIRLSVLGDPADLPFASREVLKHVMRKTAHCESMTLNLALNYSGRDEIVRACRALVASGAKPEDIDETAVAAHLYTKDLPDPDILVRTGGEYRISNFLLWQAAYAEFFFTPTLWPDFTKAELTAIIDSFNRRERRFGMTGGQVRGGGA